MTGEALGMIEARGLVCVTAAIEAMCKGAQVHCVFVERVSSGYLVAAVQGDLASVQAAVAAGADSARRYGQVRNAQVYPAPHNAARRLLERSPGWLMHDASPVQATASEVGGTPDSSMESTDEPAQHQGDH